MPGLRIKRRMHEAHQARLNLDLAVRAILNLKDEWC